MNTRDLAVSLMEMQHEGLTQAACTRLAGIMINNITDALTAGEKVSLIGLGTFKVKGRPARKGRHPQTGEEIEISARKGVRFKLSKGLKDRLNGR